jgi:hypothetical protein
LLLNLSLCGVFGCESFRPDYLLRRGVVDFEEFATFESNSEDQVGTAAGQLKAVPKLLS